MSDQDDAVPARSTWQVLVELVKTGRILIGAAVLVGGLLVLVGAYLLVRFYDDEPVRYADDRDHFKYGSTGGERGWKLQFGFGVPYWLWIVMPEVFPQYLPDGKPGAGYSALGMVYEEGKDPRFDLPVGMSMRRVMGVDRVYFTCSVCHTGSVRPAPDAPREVVLGMPANTLNFGGVGEFLRQTAHDHRFRSGYMMPAIERLADLRDATVASPGRYRPTRLSQVDQAVFKLSGVSAMRDQLLSLMGQLRILDFTGWGPGRVDTFNPPKALLGFPMDRTLPHERVGVSDFPSVWHQRARKGMWLHWDGNNCSVDERNLSAGFGTGATPATIDTRNVTRIADWLWTAAPPAFPKDRIDAVLAAQGAPIYRQYCHRCHGTPTPPFRDAEATALGQVTPIDEIGTDRARLDSYTPELARAQNLLYAGSPADANDECRAYFDDICKPAGDDAAYRALRAKCYPARFKYFRKTQGYSNQPLDGLWLRAPYLHNGSVPSVAALLEPSERRPTSFFTGYDVYDFANLGFVTSGPDAERRGWRYDTSRPGNGNKGHEGAAYGTTLPPALRRALLEYLKTF